jgi:hypothetical protein
MNIYIIIIGISGVVLKLVNWGYDDKLDIVAVIGEICIGVVAVYCIWACDLWIGILIAIAFGYRWWNEA